MLPRGYIQFPSFPTYTVSKHQILTAISFPDTLASLELQLPNPSLATSSLNIEHNEHAFFQTGILHSTFKRHHLNKEHEKNTCSTFTH